MMTETAVPEFNDEQLDRLDGIQWAAAQFLNYLAETDDVTWDLDDIWNMIYFGCKLLHQRGRPPPMEILEGTEKRDAQELGWL